MRKHRKSFHICFEGPSGSGKTIIAKMLVDRLNSEGIGSVYQKNPNGHPFGKKVTDAIVKECPCTLAEVYAFTACLCQTVNLLIKPSLKSGLWVVSDRGVGTAYAHALYRNRGVISEELFSQLIRQIATDNSLHPDLTILLSISPEDGFRRKVECEDISRLDDLTDSSIREANAFRDLSKKLSNWIVVDATNSVEVVFGDIWNNVIKLRDSVEP